METEFSSFWNTGSITKTVAIEGPMHLRIKAAIEEHSIPRQGYRIFYDSVVRAALECGIDGAIERMSIEREAVLNG